MITVFIYLAVTFALINVLSTILVVHELHKRKMKVNFPLMRLYIFKYLNQYKNITVEETGSPGYLYYLWITSINMAALSVMVLIAKQLSWF